jgi:hypothetical protein
LVVLVLTHGAWLKREKVSRTKRPKLVAALGGELEVIAHIGKRRVKLKGV